MSPQLNKRILAEHRYILITALLLLMTSLVLLYRPGTPADAKGSEPDNNTPQTLPFAQNWADPSLITANDDWSGVPGIEGYFLRNDAVGTEGLDPRTILGDTYGAGTTTVELDVLANQIGYPTSTLGGIAEFHPDGQGNPFFAPTVGFQPDTTVDAPFLLISLNTTGQGNIHVQYAVHDIDCGPDNVVQLVATQFRVGNSGNFTNLPGEFVTDTTAGPNLCNQFTIMGGDLPPAVNNQPLVQIRIINTNAFGLDEWVSVDFIDFTGTPIGGTPTPTATATATPTPPTLSINDVTQNEGNFGNTTFTFTVTRNGSLDGASSAAYSTLAGTASGTGPIPFPFDDYQSTSGMVAFASGQATAPIDVTVFGDLDFEPDETFNVNLANPIGATIGDGNGLGTIDNDDAQPPPTPAIIMINEVDSDQTGTDEMEFVELYDGGFGSVSLTGLIVVLYNGSDDLSYASFDLDGFSTNANGYFTIGNSAVPGVDLVISNGVLQNGADAVAMYTSAGNFPAGTPVVTVNLRDAFVYDTADADDPGLLPLLLAGGQVDEDQAGTATTVSMQRCPNGSGNPRDTTTYDIRSPTPDAINICRVSTLRAPFDYDGDRKTDFSVFRPSEGAWYLQKTTEGFFGMLFGFSTDRITPADYDGDGKTDIAIFRPSDLRWYIANSSDGTYRTEVYGLANDLPAPADYDGDGKADLCVFRPSDGTWYLQRSFSGTFLAYQFGASNDKPTIGDFDGDGLSDFAVFRTTNGEWYQSYSTDGSIHGEQFGFTTDKLAYADYDGDGETDLAVFRPSDRIFYIRNSATATYSAFVFGLPEDIPAPGDYDGDGKADLSVFRPSDGNWYRQNSLNGSFNAFNFGLSGDRPTPTAYQ